MKTLFYSVCLFVTLGTISCIKVRKEAPQRNYEYEAYCDSLWENDPDYYMDVLSETDEYQEYINTHGEWWNN